MDSLIIFSSSTIINLSISLVLQFDFDLGHGKAVSVKKRQSIAFSEGKPEPLINVGQPYAKAVRLYTSVGYFLKEPIREDGTAVGNIDIGKAIFTEGM